MSTSYNPKSTAYNKIPQFDELNFTSWKSKAMDALEIMDFDMLDVINKGPITITNQSSNDGASDSKLKRKSISGFNKEEKRVLNLDVKARVAIRNSLPYYIYRLVQNCSTAQEMMIKLSSAFEKENLSDDKVSIGKCLMAHIIESHVDTSNDSVGSLDIDPSQAATDPISTNENLSSEFAEIMAKKFEMSMMGEQTFFIDMLKKYGFSNYKPTTPMSSSTFIGDDPTGADMNTNLYQGMIGSLLYLTTSRPNIMFTTILCARYQASPKESHIHAIKRIFCYLKHTSNIGLYYPHDFEFNLVGYTDSDHGGYDIDRKSTS
ncbi:uncharacterized protein LOC111904752 [Lactuca sativa]|uniref:uncharacterized protein LOC111904752 n=1 Tax=Lactuca sativa TaxID=4236 RepID=UPI000CD8A3F9|nr:uncharacterized protein LOC111904752 [Lactuca sativa]